MRRVYTYESKFIEKVYNLKKPMKREAFHFLRKEKKAKNENYRFKRMRYPPIIDEIANFENDLLNMIKTLKIQKYKKVISHQ